MSREFLVVLDGEDEYGPNVDDLWEALRDAGMQLRVITELQGEDSD